MASSQAAVWYVVCLIRYPHCISMLHIQEITDSVANNSNYVCGVVSINGMETPLKMNGWNLKIIHLSAKVV